MDTWGYVFLFVVFLLAFGFGGVVAERLVPTVEGERWTQAGKRNVVRHLVGWGSLLVSALAIVYLVPTS